MDTDNPTLWKKHRGQLSLETVVLILILVIGVAGSLCVHFRFSFAASISTSSRVYLYACFGGLLGGWTFDMKWFCRAIARWKNVEPSISIDQIAKIKTYLHGENSFSEETREAIVSELQTANDGWNPNRLLWRVFTPAVAGLVAFAVYLAGVSGAIFVKIENDSGAFAYSFCFILGYFSDAVVSKMANWVEGLIG